MISPLDFRETIGNFATGVTVVTTLEADGSPRGFTANAVTSLSLDPPLLLVCVDKDSDTHHTMQQDGIGFAVNILSANQEELADTFACKGGSEKFEKVRYQAGESGAPILEDILAFVECEATERFDGGDHTVVVGKVQNAWTNADTAPLIFYRGDYRALQG